MCRFAVFILACGWAGATTISTSTTCDGDTVQGTSSAGCNDGQIQATATAGPTTAEVSILRYGGTATASASATFSETVSFTVNSGPAGLFFRPCVFAEGDEYGPGNGYAQATATFGGVSVMSGSPMSQDSCSSGMFEAPMVPVSIGVAQLETLYLSSTDNVSSMPAGDSLPMGMAQFNGFQFFNAQGQPVYDVSYSLVGVPEPNLLAGVALIGSAMLLRRPKQR